MDTDSSQKNKNKMVFKHRKRCSQSWKEKSKLKSCPYQTGKDPKGKTAHTREVQAEARIGASSDGG